MLKIFEKTSKDMNNLNNGKTLRHLYIFRSKFAINSFGKGAASVKGGPGPIAEEMVLVHHTNRTCTLCNPEQVCD